MSTTTTNKAFKAPIIAGVFLFGAFVAFLNSTFMNVAIPDIMKDLHISVSTAQWLSTGYMLVLGIMIPCTAFLIDRFRTRTLFFISMGLFTIGTIIGAFANNFEFLLAARLIQAAGAGIIIPLMQTVFLIIFPIEKRGLAMGIFGIVISFAPAIGPTLSGWIINYYPWRYLFYITLPLAIIDLILAYFLLKNVTDSKKVSLDILSLITSTAGFGGLLLGFSNAGNHSWGSTDVYIPMIVGVIALIIFVWRQLTMEDPMLNLSVFRSRVFTCSTIIIMIVYAGMISSELIIPMYLQDARSYSALDAGLALMPGAIIMGVMNPVTGYLFDKIGSRLLSLIGLICFTVGTFAFSFLTPDTSVSYIIAMYALRLFGLSMFMMPLTTSGLNTLERRLYSHGNAVNNTMRQIAGAIGTSILVTAMSKSALHSGILNPEKAMIHGMNFSFGCAGALALIGLIIAFFTVKKKEIKVTD
ncbi:DHA2 family efflux MFS transporter permease subunit [Clostridium massiliamazoniense]|uniref:DHA2 family efflux MFS transporter permease subunit n=1 Tax=Clostridium massiliamazoniense TaxID=1347366 RepID=UPI0006D78B70|nr:DHA2 family efflux MFS transporter permease subunit [Clostridium massiliamazoniense]